MPKSFPIDFDRLYCMGGSFRPGFFHACPEGTDAGLELKILRAEVVPDQPVLLKQSSGHRLGDFIGTEIISIRAVSERVIEVFEREKFSGWSTYPVRIISGKGEEITGYHGLSITGRCGAVDNSLCRQEWHEPRQEFSAGIVEAQRIKVWIGIYFDPLTWDGSDLFLANWRSPFVTERVKAALETIKATNVDFDPLSEFKRGTIL